LKDQSIQLNISPAANNVFQEKNKIEEAVHIIIQHILRYSPSSSIITCNADKINEKAVLEITSHSAVDSGEKLKEIAENYKTQGTQATNLANDVGLGNIKVEIEKIGGSFYYNLTNDNSNYLKLELPSTQ
jgi:K+-sensing histidine kinase KdpD